jgi:membrane-associated phospholipid phosphatase
MKPGAGVRARRHWSGDGHDATEREANWASLIESPMHPEYPSGHSILAAAVGTVLQAEIKKRPALATASPTTKGATRRWTGVEPFVQEVSNARVYAGIHFRSATEAGEAMGQRIGELAARRASGRH